MFSMMRSQMFAFTIHKWCANDDFGFWFKHRPMPCANVILFVLSLLYPFPTATGVLFISKHIV